MSRLNNFVGFKLAHLLDLQIKDAAPHIFRRPFLYVEQNTRMMQLATFLAIGPQIYLDGLVVTNENEHARGTKPIGRIGSKQIIFSLLDSDYPDGLETKALQIMDSTVDALEIDSTLASALEVFDKTKFAFVPIVANIDNERNAEIGSSSSVVVAALAIRDILPLIAKTNITIPIKQISSPLVSVDGNTSITNALNLMIGTGIRNIGINDVSIHDDDASGSVAEDGGKSQLLRIINDRKILEFMHRNGTKGLGDVNLINHLGHDIYGSG